MPVLSRFCAFVLLALLAGCASSPTPAAPQTLLLVSVDGLRPGDITAAQMPALNALGDANVRAEGMRPSYPALTFPNHYTLVTGLRPDHHGLTHNTLQDPQLGKFRTADRAAVATPGWWEGATPVWVSVQRAGLRSATMFWPGSEAAIHGVRPWQFRHYQANTRAQDSVRQVLEWLSQPRRKRPRFITLYLDQVDSASHDHGPDSAEASAARREVDTALAQLLADMQQTGRLQDTNLLIVSDHGFATVPPGQVLATTDMANPNIADAVSDGQVITFTPRPGQTNAAEHQLLGQHPHYACWRKGELPARWHYGQHPRVPAIVCQMATGWDALWPDKMRRLQQRAPYPRGSHGYDPDALAMRASFIAAGPAFGHGVRLPVFDNVDVYPLLMHLLHLPAEPNDGEITPLLPALR